MKSFRPENGVIMAHLFSSVALDRLAELIAWMLDIPIVNIALESEPDRTMVGTHGAWATGAERLTCTEMPLVAVDGRQVGTLSMMDEKSRGWTSPQIQFLEDLSVRILGKAEIGRLDRVM